MKISRSLMILPTACFMALAGCATSPHTSVEPSLAERGPSAAAPRPALDGLRVNPVVYPPSDKWSVRIQDGHWKIDSAHLKSYDLSTAGARADFSSHLESLLTNDDIPKKSKPALFEAARFLAVLDQPSASARDRDDAFVALSEVVAAFNHYFASDAPYKTWVGALPLRALDLLGYPIMTNVNSPPAKNVVAGQADPVASAWWQPRKARDEDYYFGVDRSALPDLSKQTCEYSSEKKSGGTHGGFKVSCNGREWRIKFGNETKTEPFGSRLAGALGYNVHLVDLMPLLRLPYRRDLIQDYNSRKPIKFSVTSGFGPKLVSRDLQAVYNPFLDAIDSAVLTDGSIVTAAQLQTLLVPSSSDKKFDWKSPDDSQFDQAFEKRVSYLVLREGSAEATSVDGEDLGTWSWNELGHADRRELRAFGIFAAFIGNFDIRTDNNSLSVRTDAQGFRHLEFSVIDLGAGLGSAQYLVTEKPGQVSIFPWTLVEARTDASSDESPYVFPSFNTMLPTKAFADIDVEDARWMIRKLAGITENQFLAALIASGHQASDTRLLLEKLVERRKQLISVFGLAGEFPQLMARVTNRKLNYNPRHDAVPQTQIGSQVMRADVGRQKIVNGQLADY